MANVQKVSAGEAFKPSANLENAVRDFFCGAKGFGSEKLSFPSAKNVTVDVFNCANVAIPALSPVEFVDEQRCGKALGVKLFSNSDDTVFFAIAEESIAPNRFGRALLSGPVILDIAGTPQKFIKPTASGWYVFSENGMCRVLQVKGENVCVLLSGGGFINSADNEYNGMFKIVDSGNGTINVVNGADITSQYCGETDIGKVPIMSMSKSNNKNVYLIGTYNSTEEKYVFNVKTSYSSGEMYWLLGSIDNTGNLTQIWTQGAIYFAWRFLI